MLLYAAVIILSILLPGYCCNSKPAYSSVDSCPPWFLYNGSTCVCGDTSSLGGIVTCNQTNQVSFLLLDYCMTFDKTSNDTLVFYCPYNTSRDHNSNHSLGGNQRQMIMNTALSKLNQFTCSPLRREGLYCEHCIQGFGPSIFTQDMTCHNCTRLRSGWGLYLALEFIPLTVFFFVVILIGISPRTAHLNSFVLFSQLISLLFTFGNQAQFLPPFGEAYTILIKIIRSCYGIWNLDFFKGVFSPFCVSPNISNLQVIALQFMSAFYPFVLLLIGWLLIVLHRKNFRPFVIIWRPFRRCLSHYSSPYDLNQFIVEQFVTFYLLAYTKILNTCVSLLVRGYLFRLNSRSKSNVLLLSPDIEYFSSEHIWPYGIIALLLFLIVVLTPAVFLILYPLIERKRCIVRVRVLRMFVEAFSSSFRERDDQNMDCRHFAGGYLLLRIVAVMLFAVVWSPTVTYITLSIVFTLAAVTIIVCRPYKQCSYNVLDIFFFSLLALGIFFSAFATLPGIGENFQTTFNVIIFICLIVPLLYATIHVTVHLFKLFRALIRCSCRKRRGYEDIPGYGDDYGDSQDHSTRRGSYLSLQSE